MKTLIALAPMTLLSACGAASPENVRQLAVEQAEAVAREQWVEKAPPKLSAVVPFLNAKGDLTVCGTLGGDLQTTTFIVTFDGRAPTADFLSALPGDMADQRFEADCGSEAADRLRQALEADPAKVARLLNA